MGEIRGGLGNDTLYGWQHKDWIRGHSGSDRIDSGAGDDFVNAQDGESDVATFGAGWDELRADVSYHWPPAVRDVFTACEYGYPQPPPVYAG